MAGVSLNHRQYKSTMTILFIIAIAFTTAMIGTVGVYWKQRVTTCYVIPDAQYDDCKQRTHDYLFDGYRNITNKFFVDCIMLAFNVVAFITVGLTYQKTPRAVNYILLLIIIALSLWSLACGYRSIDEEDILDAAVVAKQASIEYSLANANPSCASLPTLLGQVQAGLKQATDGLAALQASAPYLANPANFAVQVGTAQATIATLTGKQTALQTGIASCTVGPVVVSNLQDLHDKYRQYRQSVVALVIINFVAIYSLTLFYIFLSPVDTQVEAAKLEVVTTHGVEHIALKQAPSSQVEMNAQNVM